jgi:hypothetical protein
LVAFLNGLSPTKQLCDINETVSLNEEAMKNYNATYAKKRLAVVVIYSAVLFLMPGTINAQLRGSHLLGQVGLQSGTQGPPGLSLVFLPVYLYNTSDLKNDQGNSVARDFDLSSFATAPGFAWVTKAKFLGANIGGLAFVPFITNKIQANSAHINSSFALSDSYLQPIQLGWHAKQADYQASFNLYIPTGSYSKGSASSSGLGMWAYEFSAGSTIYFDDKKSWNFAALFSYEFNSKKEGSDTHVGDLLSIEGGLGKTFYEKVEGPIPMIINAGAVYYVQYKVTNDRIAVGELAFNGNKDHIYGIGPEGNIFVPSIKSLFALRWLFETGAINRFQGNTFLVTWVYSFK